jgi:hypothetical protein
MGDKSELKRAFDKYRPMLKKFGDDMGEAARKGEENVSKMSKMVKIQLDMLGIAVQKERLYYEIGKDVAGMLARDGVDISKLDKYKKMLGDMAHETDKRKRAIVRVSASGSKVKKKK